jgi:membrane protease YdiL (CAAX protease family)
MGTWRRILAALRTWPDGAGWKMVFLAVSWGLPSIALIAWAGDLAHFAPVASAATWLRVGLFLIVIPSFGEEVMFRGLLLPSPGQKLPIWRAVLTTALFVAWHPLSGVDLRTTLVGTVPRSVVPRRRGGARRHVDQDLPRDRQPLALYRGTLAGGGVMEAAVRRPFRLGGGNEQDGLA